MEIQGAKVLVTGASSGIGAALARALAGRGATVGIVARRRDRLQEVLADCRRRAPRSEMWVADLGDLDAAEQVALEAWDRLGHLDVLVNNAGMSKHRHATDLTPDDVEQVMRVNFHAPARMTLAVLPKMLARDAGVVVNVSSMCGRVGALNEAAYCASKFALSGWSEALAVDLIDTGVEIRLMTVGAVDTEIWDRPGEEPVRFQGERLPPEAAAEAIIAAIESDAFEHYLPAEQQSFVELKTAKIDKFLRIAAAAGRGEI